MKLTDNLLLFMYGIYYTDSVYDIQVFIVKLLFGSLYFLQFLISLSRCDSCFCVFVSVSELAVLRCVWLLHDEYTRGSVCLTVLVVCTIIVSFLCHWFS